MAGRDLSAELFGEQKPTGGRDLSAELFGAAASPAPTSEKETSWAQHAGNLGAGAVRGAGSIGATILAPADMINQKLRGEDFWSLKDNRERRKAMDEGLGLMGSDKESGLYTAGKIGAEIAGTAGIGGVLAKGAQAVKASPAIIRALETYGLQTGATPAKFLPKLADYGTRVGAGTVAGGIASGMIDPESAGTGALIGGIIPGVAPVVTGTGKLIASATGPLRESWRTHQGNKFLQEMLGEDAVQKAIKAIAAGKGAGQTTVADDIAAANMGRTDKFASPLVAIEEKLATQPGGLSDTAKSIVARQEAGRMAGLEGVKPDFATAIAARKSVSDPLYAAARAGGNIVDSSEIVSGIDDLLSRNPGNKRLVKELNNVRSGLVDANGNLRTNAEQVSSAMDNIKASLANQKNKFILGELADLKDQIAKAIPGYEKAQQAFAGASPPVNQSQVIQSMQDVLSGQGGPERTAAFQNVLGRGETALLKKSTGFPRYTEIDQVLNKQQMDAVTRVSKELARDAERTSLGASVDTKHLFEIADKSKGTISFPTLLSRPAMLANWIMRKVGTGADEMITQDMGKLMLSDPAAFSAKYLQEIPTTYRKMAFDTLMKHYGTPVIGVTAPVIDTQSSRSRNEQNGLLSEPTSTRRQSTSGLLN